MLWWLGSWSTIDFARGWWRCPTSPATWWVDFHVKVINLKLFDYQVDHYVDGVGSLSHCYHGLWKLSQVSFSLVFEKQNHNKSASVLSASQWPTQAPGSMTGALGSFTSSLVSSSSLMYCSSGLETSTWYKSHRKFYVIKWKVLLQRGKDDEPETITLDNGTLSSMLAHPKLILDKGKYLLRKNLCTFSFIF